ncbi:MAG: hypothetical protein ACR2N1_09320 [Rubripirellula sp.]
MSTAALSRIKTACSCGKKYLVHADLAGKRGKCKCGKVFTVPTEDEAVANIPERMCPWCGTWITADESVCEACEREAAKEDAASENAATRGSPQPFKAPKDCMPWWSSTKHQVIGGICAVTVLIAGIYQTHLNGADFINFYFGIGLACCIAIFIARLTSCSVAVFVMLLVTFEAIGAIRYGYGLTQGMHRFGFLGKMMLFGPVGIFAIPYLDRLNSSGGGGSGGGGGCGGGGCGGGCGGCGG